MRNIIDAIHDDSLLNAKYSKTDVFKLEIPYAIDDVPSEILHLENTWPDKTAYRETLLKLASLFRNSCEKFANYKIGKDSKLTEEIQACRMIDSSSWNKVQEMVNTISIFYPKQEPLKKPSAIENIVE